MSNENNHIKCPHCSKDIDVQAVLYDQVENAIKRENKKANDDKIELIKNKHKAELATVRNTERESIKKEVETEQADAKKAMEEELAKKSEKLNDFNKLRTDLAKLKREKEEIEAELTADFEEAYSKRVDKLTQEVKRKERAKNELKIKEKDEALKVQTDLTQQMQRRLEQGSMQAQGEALELAIEEWLEEAFPLDVIEEIKKGARGADCLQTVHTRERTNCGTIYYESKRTKSFQPNWIETFKNDIREKNAGIGVLVTQAMPAGMERLGQKEGIWICSFEEFKGLSKVLRETIIKLSSAKISQTNKGDKMGLLYDFLTSDEFRLQVEAIVDGFTQMKTDLDSEKRAMQNLWRKRQRQIDKVTVNTIDMHASIKGIGGAAVADISDLELDPVELIEGASEEADV